jgi:hypothetical protein
LGNNKAPGEDAITGELIKYGGEHLYRIIYNLIKQIWETEKMPGDWSTATFAPHKRNGIKRNVRTIGESLY